MALSTAASWPSGVEPGFSAFVIPHSRLPSRLPGTLDRVDPQVDLVRSHRQAEQVQVDRPEREVQHLAGARDRRHLRAFAAVASAAGMRTFSFVTFLPFSLPVSVPTA